MEPHKIETKKTLVLVLHGLGNSKSIMSMVSWYLRRKQFVVLNLGYPSLRFSCNELTHQIAEELLKEWRKGLYSSVSIVGFSLGSKIARNLVNYYSNEIIFSRIVMIGPPNQGADIGRYLRTILPTTKIWGPIFDEICNDSHPNPCDKVEIGIIAGGLGIGLGINPFLKGDNDGLVRVEETNLSGAKEHKLVFAIHGTMPLQPRILRLTSNFLEKGRFAD